tara:strand:+ start:225 stop:860 length:636 start_codon:yes stop_codon:yes gene_type:complete
MSTEILKSIFSLNLQLENNESEYQKDIFDLPPLNNKSSNSIDYTLYDKSFDHKIYKMTDYEDDQFCSILEYSTKSTLEYTNSPFYLHITSPDTPNLIYNKLDNESHDNLTEVCNKVKKTLGRKRKSIPKIDKINNINISQPVKKSCSYSSHKNDDNVITIGIYTKAERREKIRRYKEKKRNPFRIRVLYHCRKRFADTRKRVGGRFVKNSK